MAKLNNERKALELEMLELELDLRKKKFKQDAKQRQEKVIGGFGSGLRSIQSGASLGLSETIPDVAKFLGSKLMGGDQSFQQVKSQDQFVPSAVGELTGALSPIGLPARIGKAAFGAFKVGQSPAARGAIKSGFSNLFKSAGAGGASGLTDAAIRQAGDIASGDADFGKILKSAGLGATFGAALSPVVDLAKGLSTYRATLKDAKQFERFTKSFRKQFEGATKGEFSKEEVASKFLNTLDEFSTTQHKFFNQATRDILTKDPANPKNTAALIVNMLDDAGLIARKRGKISIDFIPTKTGSIAKLQPTELAKQGVGVGNLSAADQRVLNKEFLAVQADPTIRGLQSTKERLGRDISFVTKGEDVVLKRIYGSLRDDVIDSVAKVHGNYKADTMDAIYKVAERSIKTANGLKKVFGSLDPKSPPDPLGVYNKMFTALKTKPSLLREIKKVSPKDFDDVVVNFKEAIIKKGTRGEGTFVPNTYLLTLKKYGFGEKDDILKSVLKAKDYNQIKRLHTLSKEAIKPKNNVVAVPLFGDISRDSVATSADKFGGQLPNKTQITMKTIKFLSDAILKSKAIPAVSKGLQKVAPILPGAVGSIIPEVKL